MKGDTTVLLVEERREVAERHGRFLDGYAVRTARTVAGALERVDDDVDVALLDRRLPDGSGIEVLAEIRRRRLACRVAVVTAVPLGFDAIEVGFDGWVSAGAGRKELREVVEALLDREAFDAKLRESAAPVLRRAYLESTRGDTALDASEADAELTERIDRLHDEIDDLSRRFSSTDYRAVFRDLGSGR
ncbi:response regulator [Halegenticoccus tardaugens]|uniref:response regulator n=1 Tax=Halegenticoccus tardaugens TaxID=2071624 RepID=UPI00100AA8A0|nr:response regulator [Halegenticoccus tardaugens]